MPSYWDYFLPWRNPHPVDGWDTFLHWGKWGAWGTAITAGGAAGGLAVAGGGGAAATGGTATAAEAVTAFGGPAAFGRLIGWGIGARAAAARAASITLAEIQKAGITLAVARYWRDFYQAAVNAGQGGATAVERLRLMERIIELLGG